MVTAGLLLRFRLALLHFAFSRLGKPAWLQFIAISLINKTVENIHCIYTKVTLSSCYALVQPCCLSTRSLSTLLITQFTLDICVTNCARDKNDFR